MLKQLTEMNNINYLNENPLHTQVKSISSGTSAQKGAITIGWVG